LMIMLGLTTLLGWRGLTTLLEWRADHTACIDDHVGG